MNKKITLGTSIALVIFAILLAFTATYLVLNKLYQKKISDYLKYTEMYEKLNNLDKIVKSEYIGDVDDEAVMDGMLKGYISGIGDKYAAYYNEEEYANLVLSLSGKMTGIGVTVSYDEKAQAIKVIGVTANSPADGAGIAEGDMIIGVDGLTVANDGYNAVVESIAGNEGESVTLTVIKADTGSTSELKIVRAVVSYSSVSSRIINDYIGVVQITEFNKSTPEEFKKIMEKLKSSGINSFIFDLRNNLGGELDAVCSVLDYILPEGPIVRLLNADGEETVISSDKNCLKGNICVLTNNYTASAAELFSSAIKDYKLGYLVGTVTYGKGRVQSIKKFADNTGMKISTELYMPPFSDNFDGIGVFPDITVEYAAGENGNEDSQMTAAVEKIDELIENGANTEND